MIVDTLDNLSFYLGLSKELDYAISVLKRYDLSLLKPGAYPNFPCWDSNSVLKILEPEIVDESQNIPWEYHENAIDVQCVLKGGTELIGYAPRNKLKNWAYDEKNDVAYSSDTCSYLPIHLEEKDFIIFFPQDAHRKIRSSGAKGYHKAVFKVPLSEQSRRKQWSFE